MFGYTLEEVRGASLHFAIHHTRPDGTPYPIEECPIHRVESDQGRRESYEETFIRKDGRFVPVAATTSPIVRDGVAVASLLEMRDLTGEREAGEQIEKFAALVETSTDFVAMSDLGGHGLYVNPAGLELLGLAADAVARTTDSLDWCTPATAALFEREAIPRALQGDSYRGEWALRSFDTGDDIPVEGVVFLVRDPHTGSPRALGTVQRDIPVHRQRAAERDELKLGPSKRRPTTRCCPCSVIPWTCRGRARNGRNASLPCSRLRRFPTRRFSRSRRRRDRGAGDQRQSPRARRRRDENAAAQRSRPYHRLPDDRAFPFRPCRRGSRTRDCHPRCHRARQRTSL